MSVIPSIEPTRDVDATIDYLYFGDEREHAESWRKKRSEHLRDGTDRVAYVRSTCGSRQQFAQACKAHGRKVKAYTFVQSFAPEEFDWQNPEDVSEANALGFELAQRLYPGCDVLVITHVDGSSRAVHNHIVVANDWYDLEAGKHRAITQNRKLTQVRAENDRLMEERGRESLGRRAFSWAEKRKGLKRGSFDLALGDAVARAKAEAVDMDDFRRRLVDEGVELHLGSGATYKMRHGGRLRRRSATRLADEFRIDQLELHFEAIAQRRAEDARRLEDEAKAKAAALAAAEEAYQAEVEEVREASLALVGDGLVGEVGRACKKDFKPYESKKVTGKARRYVQQGWERATFDREAWESGKAQRRMARDMGRASQRLLRRATDDGTALVGLLLMAVALLMEQFAERRMDDARASWSTKLDGKAQDKLRDEFQRWEDSRTAQMEAVADDSATATAKPDGVAVDDSPATRTLADMERDLRAARAAEKAAKAEDDMAGVRTWRGKVWDIEKEIKAHCKETGEVSEALDEWKVERDRKRAHDVASLVNDMVDGAGKGDGYIY